MYDSIQENNQIISSSSSSSTTTTNPSRDFPPLPAYPPLSSLISNSPVSSEQSSSSGISQTLADTINQMFNGKKTFLDTVRERRKARQEMIARLIKRFNFIDSENCSTESQNEKSSGDDGLHDGVITSETSLARKSIILHSNFDPNDDSQFQDEIERILNLQEDEEEEVDEFEDEEAIPQEISEENEKKSTQDIIAESTDASVGSEKDLI